MDLLLKPSRLRVCLLWVSKHFRHHLRAMHWIVHPKQPPCFAIAHQFVMPGNVGYRNGNSYSASFQN